MRGYLLMSAPRLSRLYHVKPELLHHRQHYEYILQPLCSL